MARYLHAFLVLANIALFISGERNVDVARKSAKAVKNSADAATQASNATLSLERPFFHILKADLLRPIPLLILASSMLDKLRR